MVLDFDRAHPEGPWVFVHRVEADGRRVIRWPEGKELPPGDLAQALDLPSKPWS
ncbi:hypothetical protein SCATT_16580 [Streptantibioticus cattleyicolor NRRL 8057 = DSM 46488]|uniref:Uncharacterized protein n=1 Tax=Streptantibioticus cattleyicolor (strain ATCC 35852 / DSM 46488 / JCM 4925 / NBRC 14057 / NRRL 8057) TaxID=1003195 RepID=G8WNZ6_STREN|nr:hypothetical protein SCATT_16580 [Streptantibioticus cattleyicolor NRRL 8057 = DSM 46488]